MPIDGLISVQRAPPGTTPFVPGSGSKIILLEPVETDDANVQDVLVQEGYYDRIPVGTDMYYPDIRIPNPTQQMIPEKNTVVFDIETTGLKPWECRMVCITFWNIAEGKINMATFFDKDERALVHEAIGYLETLSVEVLVGYNTAFDIQMLQSRSLAYMIPCDLLWNAELYDVQDVLKTGREGYLRNNNKSGTLEDWSWYIYGERKPFTIEECFAAWEKENAEPFIIRNRWDVAMTGDLYMLMKTMQGIAEPGARAIRAATRATDTARPAGRADVQCAYCLSTAVYDYQLEENTCPICLRPLPTPTIKQQQL